MISERKNKPQDEKESASVRRYIDIIKANPHYELSDNTLYAGKATFNLTNTVYKRLKELESQGKLNESLVTEIYPNKGEDKKHFIARFMSATKDEYPDVKQRFAVANSYRLIYKVQS